MQRVALACAFLLIPFAVPGATANPVEGLGYTVLGTDGGDAVGWIDITELAVGEPGDDTLVFRVTVATQTGGEDGVTSIDIFFGDQRWGFNPSGSCDATWLWCSQDGNAYYMAAPYTSTGAGVGRDVTGIWVGAYAGTLQDRLPGSTAAVADLLLAGDLSYTLTGCTMEDPAACVTEEEPATYDVLENATGDVLDVNLGFENATTGQHTINWTTDLSLVDVVANGTLSNGTANVTITDGAGMEQFNGTYDDLRAMPLALNATAGNWTIGIALQDAVGNISISFSETVVEVPEEVVDEPVQDTNATEEPVSGPEALQEAPGFQVVALLAGLAAMVLVRRRS